LFMTSISIDLSKKTDPLIANCLKAIKNIAEELDIDFFVVGAVVRDLILGQLYGLPTGLETRDIDLGITVRDWEHYQKLKDRLVSTGSFSADEKTVHRLIYKSVCPVDIIPFGSVETSEGVVCWPPEYSIEMNVTGFQDAWENTVPVGLAEGLAVRFVSLAGMAVLKLIAWHERHYQFPTKDAADIATLLKYYSQAGNEDRLFDSHSDLMEAEDFDFEFAGARLLGRDMAEIMSSKTKKTVLDILTKNTDPDRNDSLIIKVAEYLPDKNYENALKFLENLKIGILDKKRM
jgi:predicted nucleotidyltransferase